MKRQQLTRGGGQSVNSSHRPTHSKADSHKSHFFSPLIASSLALALGVSVASAQCQIIDGKPTNCTPADTSNSGMFVGANESTLGTVALTSLNAFYWQDFQALGGYGPSNGSGGNYTDLKFVFSSGDNNIEGNGTADNPYTITIGSQSNRVFLLNAGNKGLILKDIKGNTGELYTLDIDFSGFPASDEKFTFILNAKKLDGNITLSGGGIFKANLAEGLTGAITNNGTEATFDFTANTLNLGTDKTHNKFSIWATEGGKNIINESTLALTTTGKIMAGTRGANNANESRTGTNEITVKSLTIADGGIAVAGVNGTPSRNTIIALGNGTDAESADGKIALEAGSNIQSYFYGTNEITAGSLELKAGSITAGEKNDPSSNPHWEKINGKNIIKLGTGTLTLGGTATEAIAQIISSKGGTNTITAGAIDTAGSISADGGTNTITLTGALTFTTTQAGEFAGNIISSNGGANNITADSLTLTGDLSADGGNNTLTLKGATVTNSSIAGNIIANGGANTLNVNKGSFEVKGLIVAEGGGANNFTLGSSEAGGNQVTLTLNGANNAIGTLNMGANSEFISNGDGTLTIGTLTAKDASILTFNKGINTIEGVTGETQATFNVGNGTDAVSLTFSNEITGTGSVNLKDNTTLTLNGGKLKSLTTAGNNNINFTSGNTTITDGITASGINTFTLTGTSEKKTSAVFEGAITATSPSTDKNNFTLDSTKGATTTLNLKGASNAINTFNALGGDNKLTITSQSTTTNEIKELVLGNGSAKGLLTIENNAKDASQKPIALIIDTFESKATGSTLTISAGEVKITNALTGTAKNNNFTLDSANGATTLTLNGGNLNKLETKGANGNTINLNGGTTEIAEQITAGDGVTNTFNIGNDGNPSAKLTLSQGFSTSGGKNSFVINSGGELVLGNKQLDKGLTTTNGTTEFRIKEGANFTILNTKPIIAEQSGKNIIDTAVGLTLGEIKANGGINDIILRGTAGGSPTKMAVGAISGNGANNFTLDSTNGATALTLNGNTNQITNFTALGGTSANDNKLTIGANATSTTIGNLVLGSKGAKGLLTIENNAKDASQKPIALTIDTFESKATGSTLTISGAGEVKIKNALKNTADINFTLNSATLTLDNANGDSTIANLTTTGTNNINFTKGTTTIGTNGITAGQGVTNKINLRDNATLASNITADGVGSENIITLANNSNIKGNITATNGTNTITLTGKSATIAGNLIQKTSGANRISFDSGTQATALTLKGETNAITTLEFKSDNNTLHLNGANKNNTITTLTLNNQSNNTINLAGDKDKNGGISSRTNEFRLLTIGTSTPNTDTGLLNPNGATLTFESYIDPSASPSNATLGGKKQNEADSYGYAYSDRVIIHNAGDNKTQAEGKYQFKAYYANPNDLGSIKYTEGGTEQEGNIALFTIAKVSDGSNQGIIEFETQGNNKENNNNSQIKSTTAVGLSNTITTTLTQVATDENGKIEASGKQDYFTYFIDKVEVASIPDGGGDEGIGGGTGGSIHPYIKKSANLMIQSMAVSAVNLYLANFNSLNKRMGELRDNAYSKGVWARTFIGSQSNDFGLSDRTGYFSLQAGFDGTIRTEKANNFIGFAISYSKNFGYSSNQKNLNGIKDPHLSLDSLNAQLVELALYNSYVSNEGWYNDTIGKFSYIQNSMIVKDERKGVDGINGANAKLNTFAFTLSNEVGYRAKLGEDKAWFIDPQAELAIGHINGMNFKLNHYKYPYSVSISSAINLRARAGASIGYDFKNFTQDKGIDAKVYVGAFYEMDSFHYTDGSKGIRYQSSQFNSIDEVKAIDFDHRAVLNLGTNLTIKDATRIYLDFEKSFGGKITTDYKINAGVRYSFGEALSEKGKEVLKDKEGESVDSESKAPLKLEKGDK